MSTRFGNTLRVRKINSFGEISTYGDGHKAVIVSNSAIFPLAFVATERGSVGIIRLNKKTWRKQITHFSNSSIHHIDEVINTFFERKNICLKFKLLRPPASEKDFLCYEVIPCGE